MVGKIFNVRNLMGSLERIWKKQLVYQQNNDENIIAIICDMIKENESLVEKNIDHEEEINA